MRKGTTAEVDLLANMSSGLIHNMYEAVTFHSGELQGYLVYVNYYVQSIPLGVFYYIFII
ncbi:hypothetical protein GCM10008921_22950 [Metaclostridioides mangenotii]